MSLIWCGCPAKHPKPVPINPPPTCPACEVWGAPCALHYEPKGAEYE